MFVLLPPCSEHKKDLEDVIKSETSGDFTKALLAMLKANRDESTVVDMALAQKDAEVKLRQYWSYSVCCLTVTKYQETCAVSVRGLC